MIIGDIIKIERKKKKITQKHLAEKIGKSERMIQKYESGEVIPSIDILSKIGEVLGVFIFNFQDTTANNVIKESSIKNSFTNNELCNLLKINTEQILDKLDLDENITVNSLQIICKNGDISKKEEAFLYANFIYETSSDIFKIVAFYYYLKNEYSIEYDMINELYLEIGEDLSKKYNLDLSLGYALGRSNELLVSKMIYINDESSTSDLLFQLYEFESTYNFELEKLNFEDKYNLMEKLASTLRYELYKISKKRSDIKANFFED